MILYSAIGPNPKAVRMFAAEKGIHLDVRQVDMLGGENRREPFLSLNPAGQLPVLETDGGVAIAEVVAICEYLEDIAPETPLIGATALERAETRMWTRRLDLNIMQPMANGFRFSDGLIFFENRIRCIPQAADDLKLTAREWLSWLDRQMEGKTYVCGSRLTLADIMLFANVKFFAKGQPIDPGWKNVAGWFSHMAARKSAAA